MSSLVSFYETSVSQYCFVVKYNVSQNETGDGDRVMRRGDGVRVSLYKYSYNDTLTPSPGLQ